MDGNHDQVVFENVADQYVKGENVTAYCAIVQDIQIYPDEDCVGLLRVGSTNIQDCLSYAPVQFDATTRHGTAIFPSASLPATDDEFYQFCYLVKKRKCLGSSIPFQLNCSMDDIDLLSQTSLERTQLRSNNDGLIAFNDNDADDLIVVHTKSMLTEEKLRQEKRQLLDINRRLEQQKDEFKIKYDLLDAKSSEYMTKVKNEMQVLATTHKATIDELTNRQRLEAKLRSEYDACRALCNQYQSQSIQFAERCQNLEQSNAQLSSDSGKLRAQLSSVNQLTDKQNCQLLDFEKRLLQSNESLKSAHQYRSQLEQQLHDLRSSNEKCQVSMESQLEAYSKQASQQENQIHALESANCLLKEELHSMQTDNTFLLTMAKQDKQLINELQEKIDQLTEENRLKCQEVEIVRQESENNHEGYSTLKNSFNEIEKRCVKHQKSEIEVKKQLAVYKQFVGDLQQQVQELTDRLLAGGDAYKTLYRKYAALERMVSKVNHQTKSNPTTLSNETGLNEEALVTLLRNSYELQQKETQDDEEEEEQEEEDDEVKTELTTQNSMVDEEIRECPMCYWEFPKHLTLEKKKDHIENHFA